MNIKCLCLTAAVFFILTTLETSAQSKEERKKIVAETNVANLKKIIKRYKQEEADAKKRVEAYCKQYKVSRVTASKMGEVKVMIDVVNGIPEYNRPYTDSLNYRYVTNNLNSKTISTNRVQPGGDMGLALTGSGIEILNWDNGRVCMEHTPEFANRIYEGFTEEDRANSEIDLSNFSDHGQRSISVMIANGISDPNVGGMAPRATAKVHYFINEPSKLAQEAIDGVILSNHSNGIDPGWDGIDTLMDCNGKSIQLTRKWSGGADPNRIEDPNFGYYSSGAEKIDETTFNAPNLLVVWAAGNNRDDHGPENQEYYYNSKTRACDNITREKDGGEDGYDCIAPRNTAKNLLSVGAVSPMPNGYTKPSDVIVKGYSGFGPADDGRIKPDIVANTDLWTRLNCEEFHGYGGTSAATPVVTGSIALLQEHYRNLNCGSYMRSASVKALVIHTADEAGPSPGPDYMHGWGLMNTAKASQLIIDGEEYNTQTGIRIYEGRKRRFPIVITTSQPFKVTVCWTDFQGPVSDLALNNRTKKLVNDIDIVLKNNDNSTAYYPWILDVEHPANAASRGNNNTDNVEQIYIDTLQPGSYTLEISNKGRIVKGIDSVTGKKLYGSTWVSLVKDKILRPDSCRVIPKVDGVEPRAYRGPIKTTLSLEDCGSICRNTIHSDNGQALTWVIKKDGQVIERIDARSSNCINLYKYNNSVGEYNVYQELNIDRQPKIISNVISYYVK